MLTSFGSVMDRLQGLLSRAYLLAGFFPAVVFFSLNLGLLYAVFPASRGPINSFLRRPVEDQLLYWATGILLVSVAGFILWSLNPWCRRLLEGRYLFRRIQDRLQQWQSHDLFTLEEQVSNLLLEVFDFRRQKGAEEALEQGVWRPGGPGAAPDWIPLLREARATGNQQSLTNTADPNPSGALLEKEKSLRLQRSRFQRIPYAAMQELFTQLDTELRRLPADQVRLLDQLHIRFKELFDYAVDRVEVDYLRLTSEKARRFPDEIARLGPTRMANVSEIHREYGLKRYGLDIEVLWPRLLKLIRADTDFSPLLDEAKTQLDFAVGMTVCLGAVTALWSLVTLVFARDAWIYLAVFGLGVPATVLFYHIVLQNYLTFTETVRSAIDLHRFDLLQALHLQLPPDSVAEKVQWEQLGDWHPAVPIVYHHGKQESAPPQEQPTPPDATEEEG